MLGIDITSISRFKNTSESFIKKILHPDEINLLAKSKEKEKFLASRWAIKEALFKATNKLNAFNQINILKQDKKYMYPGYSISTSKEGDYYIAIVIKNKYETKI